MQEEFYPFYVFTAVRKFFFFLDPMKKGRIDIRSLLTSPILPELSAPNRAFFSAGRAQPRENS